jgi:K+-sensing histidine kinase KdpD
MGPFDRLMAQMPGARFPVYLPYAAAVATSACALVATLLSGSYGSDVAPLLFLGSVAVSAWYGGLWPALLATALGFLALDYFFEYPADSFAVSDIRTVLDSLVYVCVALLLSSLNAQLRGARNRAEAARGEAEAAVRARDEALTAVSHDMRTPLTAIRTTVAALQDGDEHMPDGTRRRLLGNIASESERLEHFIGDALALGRIEAGVRPAPTLNAPGEVVSAILDRHVHLLRGRSITFDVPDSLPLVCFDAALLEQTLGNLLDNVAAHTPPGTEVAIRGRIDQTGSLRLEVADSGPGIPPEARERVFHKFERLDSHAPGAGLGLTLARAAIQAQHGQLWAEPSASGGACFVVCLPGYAVR